MAFNDDVRRFAAKVDSLGKRVHDGVCDLAFTSIVEGSPVTGAPGQPVRDGILKGSWQREILGPLTQRIVTNLAYAPGIEDGIGPHGQPAAETMGPITLRSQVGGFHSVKLTRAGWGRIMATVVQQVGT